MGVATMVAGPNVLAANAPMAMSAKKPRIPPAVRTRVRTAIPRFWGWLAVFLPFEAPCASGLPAPLGSFHGRGLLVPPRCPAPTVDTTRVVSPRAGLPSVPRPAVPVCTSVRSAREFVPRPDPARITGTARVVAESLPPRGVMFGGASSPRVLPRRSCFSAIANASIDSSRADGFFAKARVTSVSSGPENADRIDPSDRGVSYTCFIMIEAGVSPSKGGRPTRSS